MSFWSICSDAFLDFNLKNSEKKICQSFSEHLPNLYINHFFHRLLFFFNVSIKFSNIFQYKIKNIFRGGHSQGEYRTVIHYRDLDAPREPEEFI